MDTCRSWICRRIWRRIWRGMWRGILVWNSCARVRMHTCRTLGPGTSWCGICFDDARTCKHMRVYARMQYMGVCDRIACRRSICTCILCVHYCEGLASGVGFGMQFGVRSTMWAFIDAGMDAHLRSHVHAYVRTPGIGRGIRCAATCNFIACSRYAYACMHEYLIGTAIWCGILA
jgi:hypothetical protein